MTVDLRFVSRRVAPILCFVFALAAPVVAQGEGQPTTAVPPRAGGEPGRAHSLEIVFGGELLTAQTLGTSQATFVPNSQGGSPFTYFAVDGKRNLSPAFRGRIGYNLSPTFTVEGGIVVARGNIAGTIAQDSEGATAAAPVTDRLTQYFVDLSILAHLRHMAFASGAGVPFLEAGGGYLRQVHQDAFAINTGQIYHFGGGVTYMFSRRATGRIAGLGLRVDGRVYVPRRGYTFGGSQHLFGAVGGSLVVAF